MPPPPESNNPAEIRILVTTFAKEEQAADVVRTLVRERLAACGTLLPHARSIYAWEGSLEDTGEVIVLLKTTAGIVEKAAARLKELHPYDVPEILILDAGCANPDYSNWIAQAISA